ncbi:MAG: ParA family protein [Clostridia bacterium]|nr:ParA family protein [Clostridia bacterium]
MKVIAFGTLKGGTGKTTVAFNVGGILAEEHKVLFLDIDPQSNLSDNVGVDTTDQDGATIRDVLNDPYNTSANDVITKTPMWQLPNLDIISSHIRLTATELQLAAIAGRERILQKWMDRNRDVLKQYDYIIIDTNPSMGIVNQNAFMSADKIILVSDVSKKAIQGAQLFTYLWGEVCENTDVEDKTSALILNNCDRRIGLTRDIKEYYKDDEDFGKIVLDSTIPSRVDIKNTEIKYLPINLTAPDSVSCEAFRAVVSELKERKVL